jgi:hypothetical protein
MMACVSATAVELAVVVERAAEGRWPRICEQRHGYEMRGVRCDHVL